MPTEKQLLIENSTSRNRVSFKALVETIDTSNRITLSTDSLPSNIAQLWIFDDGNYSLDSNPSHTYDSIGTYNVLLRSNGTYKPSRPTSIPISNSGATPTVSLPISNREVELKASWNPIADEYVYFIITIENKQPKCPQRLTGVVTFQYPADQLTITPIALYPTYHKGFVPEPNFTSNGVVTYHFQGLGRNEQRHLIIEAKVVSSLSINTAISCSVTLEDITKVGLSLPGCSPHGDTEPILLEVKARPRDPNNKLVSESTIHEGQGPFRLFYTINFQNIAGNSAEYIRIEDEIDTAFFDLSSFQVEETSHFYEPVVFANNKAIINFPNINLKSIEEVYQDLLNGTLAREKLQESLELTRGFIIYSILTHETYQEGDTINNQALITFRKGVSGGNVIDSIWTNITETLVLSTKCEEETTTDRGEQENTCSLPKSLCVVLIIASLFVLSLAILILAFVLLQQL